MVKIARGTTGQADFMDRSPDPNPYCIDSFIYPGWPNGEHGFVVSTISDQIATERPPFGYAGEAGWLVGSTGMVTVPNTAAHGVYYGSYLVGGGCDPGLGFPSDSVEATSYEFEVVCMTVTITATQTPEP